MSRFTSLISIQVVAEWHMFSYSYVFHIMYICGTLILEKNLLSHSTVVNFQILYPEKVNEDIGSVEICIEQMNGKLSEEINIRVQTSQIGTTATGMYPLQM